MLLSKKLRNIILASASVLMCLGLASGTSAHADSRGSSIALHNEYQLYEELYRMPTSYSSFKNVYDSYQKMTPAQQTAERKMLIQKSDKYYQARTAKERNKYHRIAQRAVNEMDHSHGTLNYFKNICRVLDSPYSDKKQVNDAFDRYQKVYPKILRLSSLRGRYNASARATRKSSIYKNMDAYRDEAYKAINYDREAHHLKPVHYSKAMNEVAGMRAKQLTHAYTHFDPHGKLYMADDMKRLHIKGIAASENIDVKSAPSLNIEPAGQIYIPLNGHEMADESEDQMVYHDDFNDRRPGISAPGVENKIDNGHRRNILDPGAKTVGIAVGYNKKTHSFYIAEDFHTSNKKRAKYNGKIHYHDYLKDKGFRK